ncbi:hypothetical protein FQA39_LY17715 [Lamprigera yunnana]|nr:hypothetical protein FQA39_LY17715 [Lamprigera yunnana]
MKINLVNYVRFRKLLYFKYRNISFQKKILKDPLIAGTIVDVENYVARKMGVNEKKYEPTSMNTENRAHLNKYLVKNQSDLPPRTMQDSFASAIIPLNDVFIRNKYVALLGSVRVGRLLEDMDIFAVYICHLYILNPNVPTGNVTPYTIATARVDKIIFTDISPKNDEDIKLSGFISWVGSTSLEVMVWLERQIDGQWKEITKAVFLMVARDSLNIKGAVINPLIATNDEEATLLKGGDERKKMRLKATESHITKVIPTPSELQYCYELFTKTIDVDEMALTRQKLPPDSNWSDKCKMSQLVISHPEHRNLHNKVFGGFMMRLALEFSYGLGYHYTTLRPKFKYISDITFTKPVEINSLLQMHAQIVYTEGNFFEVMVYAEQWDAEVKTKNVTNVFFFTYECTGKLAPVYPRSYMDAMQLIQGYRNFKTALNI